MLTVILNDLNEIEIQKEGQEISPSDIRKFHARWIKSYSDLLRDKPLARNRYNDSADKTAARITGLLNKKFSDKEHHFISHKSTIYHYCEDSDSFKRLDSVSKDDCASCKAAKVTMERLLASMSG